MTTEITRAIEQMIKIGNELNWNNPIDQDYVNAINGLKKLREDTEITCFVCGEPITGKDYDNRYSWHEPDCPNTRADEGDEIVECECDIETHSHCIPDWVKEWVLR